MGSHTTATTTGARSPARCLPILPLDERRVDGLHSDGYAWKRGGRLLWTLHTFAFTEEGRGNNAQRAAGDTAASVAAAGTTATRVRLQEAQLCLV